MAYKESANLRSHEHDQLKQKAVDLVNFGRLLFHYLGEL